jgi:hypothetical protein
MAIDGARSSREYIAAHAIRLRYHAMGRMVRWALIPRRRGLMSLANTPGVMHGDGTS